MILLKNRMYSLDTSASFIKRIAMLGKNCQNENYIIALLLLIKRILIKYPGLNFLIDLNESDFDNFDYKNTVDPDLCNGKLTNILDELKWIENKYCNNKLIKRLV